MIRTEAANASSGGTHYEGNLVPCCKSCNSSKSGYTVIEWRSGLRLAPELLELTTGR